MEQEKLQNELEANAEKIKVLNEEIDKNYPTKLEKILTGTALAGCAISIAGGAMSAIAYFDLVTGHLIGPFTGVAVIATGGAILASAASIITIKESKLHLAERKINRLSERNETLQKTITKERFKTAIQTNDYSQIGEKDMEAADKESLIDMLKAIKDAQTISKVEEQVFTKSINEEEIQECDDYKPVQKVKVFSKNSKK